MGTSLLDVLGAAQGKASQDSRGPQPGRVVSYAGGKADIDPIVVRPEDPAAPTLRSIRVLWPLGIDGELVSGDLVLLIPCERDISRMEAGPGKAPSARKSSLADCVALPLWSPTVTQAVAVAQLVQTALNTIVSTFNAHVHPAPGGATSAPATPMASLGPVAGGVRVRP